MPRTNPNEPANPCAEGPNGFKGLTKREAFAATILAGICAHPNTTGFDESTAEMAVVLADDLIAELNKPRD